ncbi:hypothetical protein N665_0914s0006 [Sinapis alba]|nr:hypothetical protein N665_0914s0006 [Sinapis alba]
MAHRISRKKRFTLLGRVTNPNIQKTRALVNFFLQHWKVEGTFTGQTLGPNMFQFKFEYEQDLQVEALETIGNELGPVKDFDVKQGSVRVLVNGLKPLEITLEVSTSSGNLKQVELEYEDLEKHCFVCHSLSHKKYDCPSRLPPHKDLIPTNMGISQTRTRERLEADKICQTERKQARSDSDHLSHGINSRKDPHRQTYAQAAQLSNTRPSAKSRLSFSRESAATTAGGSKARHHNATSRKEWRHVVAGTHGGSGSKSVTSHNSHVSHTPSPRPHREDGTMHSATPDSSQLQQYGSVPSQERRSVLNRLSFPSERIPLLHDGVANSQSGSLQEVEIQFMEETRPFQLSGGKTITSSFRNPIEENTGPYDPIQDRSPIRTLSEDKLHVSLRLGPLRDTELDEEDKIVIPKKSPALKILASTVSRADKGKRVMPPQAKRQTCRSPLHGVSLNRRRVTRAQNSPRPKILQDAIKTGTTTSKRAGGT